MAQVESVARIKSFRGKVVGDNWYIHRDSMKYLSHDMYDEILRSSSCLAHLGSRLIADPYKYDIVKLNVHDGDIKVITYLYVGDWEKYHGPVLMHSVTFSPYKGGKVVIRSYHGDSAPVYHHKWMMVMPEDAEFDFAAAKIRSESWENNPVIQEMKKNDRNFKSRIGFRGYWHDVCIKSGIQTD